MFPNPPEWEKCLSSSLGKARGSSGRKKTYRENLCHHCLQEDWEVERAWKADKKSNHGASAMNNTDVISELSKLYSSPDNENHDSDSEYSSETYPYSPEEVDVVVTPKTSKILRK